MPDYDVIVIGGGGAGMAAAISAGEAGARVLIIEAADRLGGSTGLSHGVFYAAGTKVQEAAGIRDSADAMYIYGMALNQYRMRPSLLRRYCDEGADTLHWLMNMGVEFRTDQLYASGTYSEMSGVARCHAATGFGAAIAGAMEAALQNHDIDIALRTRVRRLLVQDGAVFGVEVDGNPVTAGAVLVATGGFGSNRDLLARYYPDAARHGDESWYIGSEYCQGDGLELGRAVGADVGGFNTGLLLVTPNLEKVLEMPASWMMLVNTQGRRFMSETVGYGVMSGVVDAQPGGICFGIMDAATFADPPYDPRFADYMRSGVMQTQWNRESLDRALAGGRLVRGESLAELAGKLGIRAEALERSVLIHNSDAAAGKDNLFFKEGAMMRPLGDGPYYGTIFRSAIICFTSTGLRIDEEARVLDAADRPIRGLYAAGEASSGVLGEAYLGSGSAVAHVITYGRIAGRTSAAFARAEGQAGLCLGG